MKAIDEKGRIFGRVNIIDLLVLILIAAVLLVVGWKALRGDGENPLTASTNLTYTVRVNNIDKVLYDELDQYVNRAAGRRDQLMASGNLLPAYVVDVRAEPHVNYGFDAEGNSVVSQETGDNARLDIYFTIEASVANPIVNEIGTQEVRTGKSHIVKTVHFEFVYGTVYSCDWE